MNLSEIVKKAARSAPEPEAAGRRPARMGVFTLGPVEPPPGSKPEEREDSGLSEVSRVSRVSRALMALDQPSRRGLWILLGVVILAGVGVLFMPEALRSRLGSWFTSAGSWVSEKTSSGETPQAVPSTMGLPKGGPEAPPSDAYEPPPPGEGSPEPEPEPEEAPAPTPAAPTPRPRKPEAAKPTDAAAKPAPTPKKPAQAPAIQAKPAFPEPEPVEETGEPEEPSVGPAEVDPSIQPLEVAPPEPEP